jgi:hypothetical protein
MKMHHKNLFPAFVAVIIIGMALVAPLGPAAASWLGSNKADLLVSHFDKGIAIVSAAFFYSGSLLCLSAFKMTMMMMRGFVIVHLTCPLMT